MKRIIGTFALTAALAATGAMSENTATEHNARLAKLWGQETPAETGPVATAVRQNFTGIGERDRAGLSGRWADNWRGGRKHPPAGR